MTYPEGYAVAVVGAASGIGQATALQLAALGARVACLDRDDPAETAAASGGPALCSTSPTRPPAARFWARSSTRSGGSTRW